MPLFVSELKAGFNPVFNNSLQSLYDGQSSWCDFDMDGDLDVIVTGRNHYNQRATRFYRNNGGSFTQVFNNQVVSVYYSSVDWGDYDNDGDPDLLITGSEGGARRTRIYRNNSGNGFTQVYSNQIINIYEGDAKWGDYDNDGKLDIAITGNSSSGRITKIYQNTGSGFSEVFSGQIAGAEDSNVDWGDYDNDGDLDLAVQGFGSFGPITYVYRNNNGNGFTHVFTNTFTGLYNGDLKWGDYDNDGDLDLLSTGRTNSGAYTRVYKNHGSYFSSVYTAMNYYNESSADWGDYDNDGDLDLIINGRDYYWNVSTRIYKNNGSTFSQTFNGQIDNCYIGSVDWGDYDNDGDLDVLISGRVNYSSYFNKIYQNTTNTSNTAPSTPTGLSATTGNGSATLNWLPANDNQTANSSLTYHVRIGTTPGGDDVVSKVTSNSGRLLVPERGNAEHGTNFKIKGLAGGTYYWSVQAIDHGKLASSYATEHSFLIATTPTLTTNTIVSIQTNSAQSGGTISSDGNSPITAKGVVWGTSPNPTVGSNTGITNNGSGTGTYASSLTGLTQNTTYYARAYATNSLGTAYGQQRQFTTTNQFNPVYTSTFTNLMDGDASWCDFDNDGDLDFIETGRNGSSGITRLYRNNGNSFTQVYSGQIIGVYNSSVDWGDYDNDGDADLLITGNGNGSRIARIYRNNGNGFTQVFNNQLAGVEYGSAKWGDFNNDGKIDIALAGSSNSGNKAALYENTGSGFSEVFSNQIDGTSYSSLDWGDYDNDNDLDLVISGYGNFSPITRIYKNNGTSGFSNSGASLLGIYRGEAKWGDLDNDGDLDLLVTGYSNSGNRTRIYKNNNGNFSNFSNSAVSNLGFSSADWGDIDNDGDLDLIISGRTTSWGTESYIFTYNGSTYSSGFGGQLTGVSYSSMEMADFDNDNDLDLLVTGRTSNGQASSRLYRNNASIANTAPSIPSGLASSNTTSSTSLSWNASSDNQSTSNALTYNIRIGTSPGASDIVAPNALSNGKRLVAEKGNGYHGTTFRIDDLPAGTYYWSVQSIDQGYKASAFAPEATFTRATAPILTTNTIQNVQANSATGGGNISSDGGSNVTARGIVWSTSQNPTLSSNLGQTNDGNGTGNYTSSLTGLNQFTTYYVRAYATNSIGTSYGQQVQFTTTKQITEVFTNSFTGVYQSDSRWCDFDMDGDLDFAINGRNGSYGYTRFYRNNGGSFSQVFANQVEGLYYSSIDWGDYDNDGDPDLLVTGRRSNGVRLTQIYRNNSGNSLTAVYTNTLQSVYQGDAKWGDYNNDGLLDIAIIGSSNSGNKTFIYKNTGSGFTEEFNNQIVGATRGSLNWGDYDNDGDLDIVISGYGNGGPITKLYRNNDGQGFSEVFSGTFIGIYRGESKWGDIDNDGDLDLLVSGFTNSYNRTRIYKNNGGSFTSFFPGVTNFGYSSVDWGDFDNDGDLDLFINGYTDSWQIKSKIYKNNGNTFSEILTDQVDGIREGSVDWGDYDNDNDLDLLVTGLDASGYTRTKLYNNGGSDFNTAPATPTGLTASTTFGSKNATLNWSAATDNETNSSSLTYQVRIGSTPGADDIVCKMMSSTGKRLIPEHGNGLHGTEFTIKDLPVGTYYWSVQSVDHGYMNSPYATEKSFTIIDGIVWDGTSWSNTTGPTSSTGGENVYVFSGTMPLLNGHVQAKELRIMSGAALAIKSKSSIIITDSVVNDGTIQLRNSASFVQTQSSKLGGSGTFEVIRKGGSSANAYQIWSSPVENQSIVDIFSKNNLYDLYAFDASVQNWRYDFASLNPINQHVNSPYTFLSTDMLAGADGVFDTGRGYYSVGNSTQKKKFIGKAHNGNVQFPIVSTSLGNNPNWDGDDWNLVGNPYPSAINAGLFWQENAINNSRINNAIYFWSDDESFGQGYNQYADFATWNMAGGTAATGGGNSSIPDGYISSCQGFWVKSLATTNLVFTNEMRVASNNDKFYKTDNSNWEKAWLSVSNDQENYNQTLVAFNDQGTDFFDPHFDAQKLQGNPDLSFGSVLNGDQYAIQTLPQLDPSVGKVVELSIITNQSGIHEFKVDSLFNLENYDLFFEDVEKGKSVNLNAGPYVIYLDSTGTYNQRFYLRLQEAQKDSVTTSINERSDNAITWTVQENNLYIKGQNWENSISQIQLFDLNGRLLIQNKLGQFSMEESMDLSHLSQGAYIVRVDFTKGNNKTFRIVNH